MNENNWEQFAKKLSGEMSEQEEHEFSEWLIKHPDQNILFNRIKSNWIANEPKPIVDFFDTEAEWHKLNNKTVTQRDNGGLWYIKQQRWPLVAASIILLALLSIMLFKEKSNFILENNTSSATSENKVKVVEFIATDSSRVIYLPDSSKVILNKKSFITYKLPYNINDRQLTLEGEAYFEVKPSKIPFFVECNSTTTKVLGTSFNIKGAAKSQVVELKVTSGRVEFSETKDSKKKTIVSKNEKCIFNKKHKSFKTSPHYSNENEWWKKGKIKSKIKKFIKKLS